MNMFDIELSSIVNAEELAKKVSPDSLKTKTEATIDYITTSNPSELLSDLLHQAIVFGLKVLAAFAIYIVGMWLIKRLRKILRRSFARKGADPALASFVDSLVSIVSIIVLIIIAVGALGINTTSLAALLAAGGMAIGMALSGTVQNFAGGLMIMVFRPFKAGDFITAQGFSGFVEEVNIVSTKIRTVDNRIIILPNGTLSNGTIDNFSQAFRRLEWKVSVEYGSDAEKTRSIIMSILGDEPRILDASIPSCADPVVYLSELQDSGIQFSVRAWVKNEDFWPVYFSVNEKIYNELPKNGIAFPFPQLDVRIKSQE